MCQRAGRPASILSLHCGADKQRDNFTVRTSREVTDASHTPSAYLSQPGTKIGCYEIVSRLSVGGQGEVYKTRDARLNRFVAIKVLADNLSRNPEKPWQV